MNERVFVVDDHPLVRSGVRSELAGRVDVVGTAGDVDAAAAAIPAADPDVVLLAVVSGRVADLTGYRAVDAVVAAVLADRAITGDAAGTPTS